jgi:hypothetical protein
LRMRCHNARNLAFRFQLRQVKTARNIAFDVNVCRVVLTRVEL